MHADTQTLSDKLATTAARLGSVRGVHERDMTTSIYRFVGQQRSEQSQSSIVSAEREVSVTQHEVEFELFQGNQAVGMNQPMREFVVEVAPGVGKVFVQLLAWSLLALEHLR